MKFRIVLLVVLVMVVDVFSHSIEEKKTFVERLLERTLAVEEMDVPDCDGLVGSFMKEWPSTWSGFLVETDTNGWTMAEKKDAFGWYLSTVATNDCIALPEFEKELVRVALTQCRDLNYVEACDHLRRLALNPRGIYRDVAIPLVVRFGPVDDAMTDFVEMIGTNVASYSYAERGTYSAYQKRLAAVSATNTQECAVRDRAVRRFYQHRFGPSVAGAVSRDFLFRDYLAGYAQSSNRLEFACYVLSTQEGRMNDEKYFTSVTNQLLSAGQPLQQLNFEGNEQ